MASATASPSPPPRLRLRARVAALFALLGFVVSACVALVAVHFSDSYVHRLIDEMLRVEGEYLRERYVADGIVPGPRGKHFHVYADVPAGAGAPPPEFEGLAPGLHEEENPRGEVHVAVYEVDGHRLYVALDIGLERSRERRLARDLTLLVLFGSGLSWWLGWFWSGRAIEPVRRLAQTVETLEPPGHSIAPLATGYANDEVGALAAAFDRYQARLQEYVRRERAFTADASHELRTPLAVIRGAAEVLSEQGGLSAAAAARLRRIQRGADELHDLLDALLVLARSDEQGDQGQTDLVALIDTLLRDRAEALRESGLTLVRTDTGHASIDAPPRVVGVVVGNLLRTAFNSGGRGELRVTVGPASIEIAVGRTDVEPGASTAPRSPQPGERTLGLGMVRRVCERRGWALDESDDGASRAFLLRFAR
jgi:signal transduction histidine kinase